MKNIESKMRERIDPEINVIKSFVPSVMRYTTNYFHFTPRLNLYSSNMNDNLLIFHGKHPIIFNKLIINYLINN